MHRRITLLCASLLLSVQPMMAQEQWSLVRDLRIGAVDGPAALTAVGGVAIGGGGQMYVAQPREQLIRVFDARGRLLRTIGRRGSGPGEFLSVETVGMKADTLWVGDRRARRITLFSPEGDVHDTFTLLPGWSTRGGDLLFPGALLRDGGMIGFSGIVQGGDHSTHQVTRRLSRDGRVRDTLAVHPIGNGTLVVEPAGGGRAVAYLRQPFTDSPLMAIQPDGSGLILVDRAAARPGETARFFVTHVGPAGDTLWSRGYRYTPRPISRQNADSAVAALVGHALSMGATSSRARAERIVRSGMYLPDHWPPIETVAAGLDGTVWLRREADGRARATWVVLDPRGGILATLALPASQRILAARRDTVWALEHDADDVPYIVRYRVARSGER